MELVTGALGYKHVYAWKEALMNIGIMGAGDFVWRKGNKLAATIISNNEIHISDGNWMMQGRHCIIEKGTNEKVAISNGTAGYNRNDIIAVRYTVNHETGNENAEIVVIEGTETIGMPNDPVLERSGDINNGAELYEMPLYRVKVEGINIVNLEQMFKFRNSMPVFELDAKNQTVYITLDEE